MSKRIQFLSLGLAILFAGMLLGEYISYHMGDFTMSDAQARAYCGVTNEN